MFVVQTFRHFLHNLAGILGISWAFFAAHSEILLGRLVADVAGIVGERNVQLSDWIFLYPWWLADSSLRWVCSAQHSMSAADFDVVTRWQILRNYRHREYCTTSCYYRPPSKCWGASSSSGYLERKLQALSGYGGSRIVSLKKMILVNCLERSIVRENSLKKYLRAVYALALAANFWGINVYLGFGIEISLFLLHWRGVELLYWMYTGRGLLPKAIRTSSFFTSPFLFFRLCHRDQIEHFRVWSVSLSIRHMAHTHKWTNARLGW